MKDYLNGEQIRPLVEADIYGVPVDRLLEGIVQAHDIISWLPRVIKNEKGNEYELTIKTEDGMWVSCYLDWKREMAATVFYEDELIDSLYKLLIWCIDNGIIKSELTKNIDFKKKSKDGSSKVYQISD